MVNSDYNDKHAGFKRKYIKYKLKYLQLKKNNAKMNDGNKNTIIHITKDKIIIMSVCIMFIIFIFKKLINNSYFL